MKVSVIIPAHNAADTIAETLESVIAQTFQNWEAIVVDDGSGDETFNIAASFAAKDTRIHVVSQPQSGANVARNMGIRLAHFDWLLFLDADDWLAPQHLERLIGALADNPAAGVMCCGWTNVSSDGKLREEPRYPPSGDLFSIFTKTCPVLPVVCIVRRSLVDEVGGFDPAVHTNQDWDLWQRIARTGTFFGAIGEALAFYRMRPNSISVNAPHVLANGLNIITRGHGPDPRVLNPSPAHRNGQPQEQLPGKKLLFACWVAGLLIGQGNNPEIVFDSLKNDHDRSLNPVEVAYLILYSVPRAMCRTIHTWPAFWPQVENRIDQFLLALEEQSQSQGLAGASRAMLERLILEKTDYPLPLTIGLTHAIRIEITEPLIDVVPPSPCERLMCVIELEGQQIGRLILPVVDNQVSRYVLSDAIAAKFAWQLIGHFFNRHVYPNLRIEKDGQGLSVYRGDLQIASGLAEQQVNSWLQLHDQIGWTIFLQEIWNRPNWPGSAFYDPQTADESVTGPRRVEVGRLEIEVSQEPPEVEIADQELKVIVLIGGAAIGVVNVSVDKQVLQPQELRAALTSATGFELCRAAVREGLLGRTLADPTSLRSRLGEAADRELEFPCAPETNEQGAETCLVMGRRNSDWFETSASRRASLPAAAWQVLLEAGSVTGDPIARVPEAGRQPDRIFYIPERIGSEARHARKITASRWPGESPGQINSSVQTDRLPILMYHRVAARSARSPARYHVTPEAFKEQLCYLHDQGYYSIRLEEWRHAIATRRPLPGRAVLITFDDGCRDFLTEVWPLLKRYGFSATVFLVADQIGRSACWGHSYGEDVPLLDWPEIYHLWRVGIEFGSHSARHPRLTALSPLEIVREGAHSRAVLDRQLPVPVNAFAYPFGSEDQVVRHLIGACGYTFGLTCRPLLSSLTDDLLALPRIEVAGTDSFQDFVRKISS